MRKIIDVVEWILCYMLLAILIIGGMIVVSGLESIIDWIFTL